MDYNADYEWWVYEKMHSRVYNWLQLAFLPRYGALSSSHDEFQNVFTLRGHSVSARKTLYVAGKLISVYTNVKYNNTITKLIYFLCICVLDLTYLRAN